MVQLADLVAESSDAAALLVPRAEQDISHQRTLLNTSVRKLVAFGTAATGFLVAVVVLHCSSPAHPRAFRAGGEEIEMVSVEATVPGPGPWECAGYIGEQDNEWCKSANVSGYEYRYFGSESLCSDCWCCKREIEPKLKVCGEKDKSCLDEQCCDTPGFQCYKKTEFWATCRRGCTPGPDPTDDNADHWSCKELGLRAEGIPPPPDYTKQAAAWVATVCAGRGENCTDTKCCKEPGMQCYAKTEGWASCKPECFRGPDPVDNDKIPWECKELGSRTPGAPPSWGLAAAWVQLECSGGGEDCSSTQCCREPGNQCYVKKNGSWSMCMPSCLHGPLLTDSNPEIWDCSPLGGRTPGLAKVSEEVRIQDWVGTQCSADNENCTGTMCCSNPTSQCYEKSHGWAVCMRGCNPGQPREGDADDNPWTCAALGPRTPRAWGHPSLYCFAVAQIWSPEGDVIQAQINTDGGAGIFACEQFDVFTTDGGEFLGDGPSGPVWSQHFEDAEVGRSIDGTAGNTRLFINVWEAVKSVGRFWLTDWTVKVDPDAVIIPDRLRWHLSQHMDHPTFIVTCTLPGMTPIMFGAVEAISKDALRKFFDGRQACDGFHVDDWGEDRWLSGCLRLLGAQGEEDFQMVSDGVCTGVSCGSGSAAFHPFKSAAAWQGCYYEAMR